MQSCGKALSRRHNVPKRVGALEFIDQHQPSCRALIHQKLCKIVRFFVDRSVRHLFIFCRKQPLPDTINYGCATSNKPRRFARPTKFQFILLTVWHPSLVDFDKCEKLTSVPACLNCSRYKNSAVCLTCAHNKLILGF